MFWTPSCWLSEVNSARWLDCSEILANQSVTSIINYLNQYMKFYFSQIMFHTPGRSLLKWSCSVHLTWRDMHLEIRSTSTFNSLDLCPPYHCLFLYEDTLWYSILSYLRTFDKLAYGSTLQIITQWRQDWQFLSAFNNFKGSLKSEEFVSGHYFLDICSQYSFLAKIQCDKCMKNVINFFTLLTQWNYHPF